MRPSFAVEEAIRTLGANLRTARLRRRLPQSVVAERSGISLNTLSKIENGDCGVAIGNVASVLQALGLGTPFADVASSGLDETGLLLEERRLPQRARRSKTKDSQKCHPLPDVFMRSAHPGSIMSRSSEYSLSL